MMRTSCGCCNLPMPAKRTLTVPKIYFRSRENNPGLDIKLPIMDCVRVEFDQVTSVWNSRDSLFFKTSPNPAGRTLTAPGRSLPRNFTGWKRKQQSSIIVFKQSLQANSLHSSLILHDEDDNNTHVLFGSHVQS